MSSETHPGYEIPNPKETALLLVDMITDFDFEDGEKLFENSQRIVENVSNLKRHFRSIESPVIYVNDDIGHGREGLWADLRHLESRSPKAAQFLSAVPPEDGDHWVVKPQRSGFYGTCLGSLLLTLDVNSVIVTGLTTDICVLFTAHDAYMRGYAVSVPADCCAAVEDSHHDEALPFLERVAKACVGPSTSSRWIKSFSESGIYEEMVLRELPLSSAKLVSSAPAN